MNDGYPVQPPYSRAGLLAKLTGAAILAAGALLHGQGTALLATLPLGTAGRVLVAGASAPAWSDSGLSYASSVLTVAGSAPATPSSGQVVVGGGVVKAGTAVYGADGSAAAPGIRTTTYAHGLHSLSATGIGLTVGGVAAMEVIQSSAGIGSGLRLKTTADADYCYIFSDRSNAELRISPGNGTTNGAAIRLLGSTHATPSTGYLSVAGTPVLTWNATSIVAAQALTVINGSAATPGIKTSEGHGLYRNGATSLGISVAGVTTQVIFAPNGSSYGGNILLANPTAGEVGFVGCFTSSSACYLVGSNGPAAGGQVRAFGNTHATKPNYVEFTRGSTVSAYFDGSGVLTVNTSTASTSTMTGALVVTGGVGVGGAGYFGGNLSAAGGALILGGKATFNVYGGNTAAVGGIAASGWENLEFYTCTSGGTSTKRGAFDNTGKLTLTGTSDGILTVPGKIAAKVVVPGSFADLAAVQSYLASILT